MNKIFKRFSMRKKLIILLLFGFLIPPLAFADHHITRGPEIGEIYFVGPTATGEGIYYSTDFGETAICVDSISEVISICADKTPGCLYRIRIPDALYFSNNYGNYGSWVFKHTDVSRLLSGRREGFLFSGKAKHSEDYGGNFIYHSCQGYFGDQEASEIDVQNDVCYVLVSEYGILDSLWLLISYDNYENLEIQYIFNWYSVFDYSLTRGAEAGKLYLLKFYYTGNGSRVTELWYSNHYGESWELINEFNCPNLPITSIVGGRQPGEIYMVVPYIQLGYEIAHIYIYHSLDYGETFTVYHPFSHGPEPYVANFEASPFSGAAPLTVQFTDLSTGENIYSWEWDFDNDGIIDSYEQYPEYTYQDTGYYSVSLTINYMQTITASRYNYIHVTDTVAIDEDITFVPRIKLNSYPNPIVTKTEIYYSLPYDIREVQIDIYNIKGQLVREFKIQNLKLKMNEVVWDGKDKKGKEVGAGMYFIYMKTGENISVSKIVKLNQ